MSKEVLFFVVFVFVCFSFCINLDEYKFGVSCCFFCLLIVFVIDS